VKRKSFSRKGADLDDPNAGGPCTHGAFYTIAEVAEILNVCDRTVRRWIDREKLVAHDLEGPIRIAESDLAAFIAHHRRVQPHVNFSQ